MNQCLICTKSTESDKEYHEHCLTDLFGSAKKPSLDYSLEELSDLAKNVVKQKITIPGVQAKLSLEINKQVKDSNKLTIVGLWGNYILKLPSNHWPELPANEHCTMLMAQKAGIATVPFGLIRLKSGELSYITRRIDRRSSSKKIAMEDMCQLSERLTEDKYKGSHEQIAKLIKKYIQ